MNDIVTIFQGHGGSKIITGAISKAIVDVNQSCIVSAMNVASISVETDCAKINNVQMVSNTHADDSGCFADQNININDTQAALDKVIDTYLPVRGHLGVRSAIRSGVRPGTNLAVTIRETLTAKVVNTCMTMAQNVAIMDLGVVDGCVEIENVKINQKATAIVDACVQSTRVNIGDTDMGSLSSYLERNEKQYAVPNPFAPQPEYPPCPKNDPEVSLDTLNTVIGIMSSLAAVSLVFMIGAIIWNKRRKLRV